MPDSPEQRLLNLFRHIRSFPLLHLPAGVELSPPAVALLRHVSQSPGCGVLDMAKELQLSPPTISVGIRRLAEDGWLERRRDPEDLRARPLYLTPKAEELIQHIRDYRTQILRCFLSGLTQEEQEELLTLLEKAVNVMSESFSQHGEHQP